MKIAAAISSAEADSDLFEEVRRNLYENAIKYAPQGDAMVTRVSDDGSRIVPEPVTTRFSLPCLTAWPNDHS